MRIFAISIICLGLACRPAWADVTTGRAIVLDAQVLLRGTLDADLLPGGTDLNGDAKQIEAAVFQGAWTAQARWRMASPQNPGARVLHDTGVGYATLGFSDEAPIRAYLNFGVQNGRLLDAGHGAFESLHKMAGFKGMRRSPASTAGKTFASVDLVAQKAFSIGSTGLLEFGLSPIAWSSVGSNQAHAGGGLLAVIGLASPVSEAQINPLALAQTRVRGAHIYAGAMVRHVFHDDYYKGVATRAALVTAVVGAKAEIGGYVAGAEMSRPLTPEARGVKRSAVGLYSASVGKTF